MRVVLKLLTASLFFHLFTHTGIIMSVIMTTLLIFHDLCKNKTTKFILELFSHCTILYNKPVLFNLKQIGVHQESITMLSWVHEFMGYGD